jgi:hypothetical protein
VTSTPVFVGGCPRSGTTLMRSMLNAHPDLAIPHETRFVVDAYRNRRAYGDLSQEANAQKLARFVVKRKQSRIDRLDLTPDQIVEAILDAPPTIGSKLAAPYSAHAAAQGKARWGDKRPHYVLNLDAVFAMFPQALYVNMVRDPRSAVASINEMGANRNWYEDGIIDGLDVWTRSQLEADRWRRKVGPERFYEVRYESLVEDPESELAKLTAFLDLDPEGIDSMLTYHETRDVKAPKLHKLVRKPVTTAAVRRFETSLEPTEVALIERELATEMGRYGYEPVASGVAVSQDLEDRLAERRKVVRGRRFKRWAREQYRRVTYRHPVALRDRPR